MHHGPLRESDESDNIMTRLNEQFRELTSIEDDLRRQKDELENQLKEIQDSIVVAHRAVKTKQSEIHEYNNKFNPIVSLPSEILSFIFLDVVGFQIDHGFTLQATYSTPPVLALVCQRWRNIVLGDPMLWTHLNIEHSRRRNLKLYIHRSVDLPLDITMPLSKSSRTPAMICDPVVREAYRWRRLWIDSSSLLEDDIRPLLSQKRAESLTYICLVNNRKRRHHIRPVFAPCQNHLRTLILIRTPMPKVLVAPHLQHLTFTGGWEDTHPELTVSYHRLRHILTSTTNLQTLGISVQSVVFGEKVEPILLPHLRHLTLYFHADTIEAQLSDLLDMISAPALQTIELTGEFKIRATYDAYLYLDFILGRIPRYPTVTTAILYNVIYNDIDAGQLIDSFPDIKSLTVNSFALSHLNSALQEHDRSASSSKSHWDSLEHIRVHVPQEWNADFEESDAWTLCDLLLHRQEQGLPPLRLELVMDQKPTDEDHGEWLDELDSLSILTVVDASEDTADAPWKFWANYGRSCLVPRKVRNLGR